MDNFGTYQCEASRTLNSSLSHREAVVMAALGLNGEAGEVAELVKKWAYHDQPLDLRELTRELGDVLWYLAALCTLFSISLLTVARANIRKLTERHPQKFDPSYHEREKEDAARAA